MADRARGAMLGPSQGQRIVRRLVHRPKHHLGLKHHLETRLDRLLSQQAVQAVQQVQVVQLFKILIPQERRQKR